MNVYDIEVDRLLEDLEIQHKGRYVYLDGGGGISLEIEEVSYADLVRKLTGSLYSGIYAGITGGVVVALQNICIPELPVFADMLVIFEIQDMRCTKLVANLRKIRVFSSVGEKAFYSLNDAMEYIEDQRTIEGLEAVSVQVDSAD